MTNEKKNIWDGERLETNVFDDVAVEHLHRYAIAMDITRGKDVLDIASGEGYGSCLMASVANSVIGVDISQEAVKHADEKYNKNNLKYLQGSADNIPVQSNSIDIVVSFETIEHHDKHEEMMREIKRVLKPDGLLVMSSPDKLNYSDIPGYQNPYHIKELYLEEFRLLINKYFKNNVMFLQRMVYGSLVSPEHNAEGFKVYSGEHDSISSFQCIQNPVYNVCVASDSQLDEFGVSFFDGKKALDTLVRSREINAQMQIMHLRSYKLGRFLTSPKRFLGNLIQKIAIQQ